MIHVDVRSNEPTAGNFRFVIETSVDGGPWAEQWNCNEESRARTIGRVFASGVAFAGQPCKLTMFGEAHSVPGNPVISEPVSPAPVESIAAILWDYEVDGVSAYVACECDYCRSIPEDKRGHVFEHFERVARWLENVNATSRRPRCRG